jgi:hypothetical protein
VKAEDIEHYIRVIHDRTNKPVGSFSYFAKAILKEQQSPKTRRAMLDQLRKIVDMVRDLNVGRSTYSYTDFREDIKTAAARAGIAYPPDLLEEAMEKKR